MSIPSGVTEGWREGVSSMGSPPGRRGRLHQGFECIFGISEGGAFSTELLFNTLSLVTPALSGSSNISD